MRKLKLPISNTFSIEFSVKNMPLKESVILPNGKRAVHIGEMGGKEQSEELNMTRQNSSDVIWSTLRIEKTLEKIITNYLFTVKTGFFKERNLFLNEIVQSTKFTFNDKRDLTIKIVKLENLASGKKRNDLNKKLADVIKFRNAFVHGSLVYTTDKGVILSYYSGKKEQFVLDESFLSSLELNYKVAYELLN